MSMCGICWFDGRALTDEMYDLRMRLKELERAEKDRDILVGILSQVRCYVDSPRFDEEGEVTEMIDEILKKMP